MSPDRPPQQGRSRATRERLLAATVTCLARDGWTRATTSVIAEEAGISRGAVQYHYPTREALIIAALQDAFERRMAAVERTPPPEQERVERIRSVARLLLDSYIGELFRASLQVWTVAGVEPELREQVVPLERSFARTVHDLAVRLLDADDGDPHTHALIQATLDLARGLGLADLLTDDSRRRRSVADAWAVQLASIDRLRDPDGTAGE